MASAREAVFGFFSETTMKLSVIIPAYNEFSTIAETLIDIHVQLCEENIIFEIIVVNDGSTDHTIDEINKLKNKVIVQDNKKNLGFAKSIKTAIKKSNGDYFLWINHSLYVNYQS